MNQPYRPALDLSKVHFTRIKHGIRVQGTWLIQNNKQTPCLVLTNAGTPLNHPNITPIVIPLEMAWRYASTKTAGGDEVGDSVHVYNAITGWLNQGLLAGSAHSGRDCMQVLDAINDNLRDLYAMPPQRATEKEVVGEVTIRTPSTGRERISEVINHV